MSYTSDKVSKIFNIARLSILIILVLVLVTGCSSGKIRTDKKGAEDYSAAINLRRDYLTIANKDNPYKFGGEYAQGLEEDLVYTSDINGQPIRAEKAAFLSFSELQYDLENEDDIRIGLASAYRTKQDQEEYAKKVSTAQKPGETEHHTGLLLTYAIRGQDGWYSSETPNLDLERIQEALPKYGFIIRYPEGKEQQTGVKYTPYEIRFVGSSKIAQEITDKGISLEEYLANR